jgi:hypothetical protein
MAYPEHCLICASVVTTIIYIYSPLVNAEGVNVTCLGAFYFISNEALTLRVLGKGCRAILCSSSSSSSSSSSNAAIVGLGNKEQMLANIHS